MYKKGGLILSKENRLRLIRTIEEQRKSKLVCYITGDRKGYETRIATDVFSIMFEHLSKIGTRQLLDLFIYSTGGITIAGWGLVNLIREFCEKFCVIIPFKAYSCATLIALGANEIIMGKLGQLSPIDPSTMSPYNPPAPGQPAGTTNLLPVNVEDVLGYLDLGIQRANLREDASLARVFQSLSDKVHPLALGAVYRAREQTGILARKLLKTHMSPEAEREIDRIASVLSRELFSHDYLISRKEAQNVIGLKVIDIPSSLEETIWQLYKEYEGILELGKAYHPATFLGNENEKIGVFRRAVIESTERTDIFKTEKEVKRITRTQPGIPIPVEGFQERVIKEGWEQE
ncbi:MAG TPA: serine protease [Syntrophaceae bacterium]|nr:serine protease [Syntrophaceae bacterium]